MLIGSQALVNDPYYNDVGLHLRGYDAQSGQVFKDYSKYNRTITANGNVAHSTTQKKYGNSSIYFDGSGDYLTVPASSDFSFGTGDFTIEAFVNPSALSSTIYSTIIGSWLASNTYGFIFQIKNNNLVFAAGNNGVGVNANTFTNSFSNGLWVYVCLIRNQGLLYMFINGTQIGSATNNSNIISSRNLFVGFNEDLSTQILNGYIEDLRITKGIARPIAVPAQPFPNW